MQTGENEHGLRQILDFIRFGSVLLLLMHFYCTCYPSIRHLHLTIPFVDTLVFNLSKSLNILSGINRPKLACLFLLCISLIGVRGKKDENLRISNILFYLLIGLLLYFLSSLLLYLPINETSLSPLYISVTTIGYISFLSGGAKASRILKLKFKKDIFNETNETFPQEERKLTNEYSINLRAQYSLKGKIRKSWINIINPFRALFVLGTPGSGKSYFVIRHVITQHIEKGFSFFIYDFKFPDLTRIAYNHLRLNYNKYEVKPKLYIINFEDLSRSHRCNPLSPDGPKIRGAYKWILN